MGQKKFYELIEKALAPASMCDLCFPIRWAIIISMIIIACGAFVAVGLLRSISDEKLLCIIVVVFIIVSAVAFELSVRIISAHRDIEIKKLDVLKDEIAREREKQGRDYEERLCAASLPPSEIESAHVSDREK